MKGDRGGEKQRGRDLSEETALAGAQRAKEKEWVREGWEGRREEKGVGGVGWSELTHCLPTAARSWIRRPFRPKEGKKRVEESERVLDTWLHCFLT